MASLYNSNIKRALLFLLHGIWVELCHVMLFVSHSPYPVNEAIYSGLLKTLRSPFKKCLTSLVGALSSKQFKPTRSW